MARRVIELSMDASDLVDSRKRAALALLGLHAADQKWLLGQLPDSDRDGVAALLDELERMNLPATVGQLAATPGALTLDGAPPEPASAPDDALRAVMRASPAAVHRELRTESDSVIALVCALRNWRWRDELLGLLGPTRAADIGRLQREVGTPTQAMTQALIAALAARIEAGRREAGFAADLRAARAQDKPGNGRWWSKWSR